MTDTETILPAKTLSAVESAHLREQAIIAGLAALGATAGVSLDIGRIDARGDILVKARSPIGGPLSADSGKFGGWLAYVLNSAKPRTGIAQDAVLCADSSWCFLNHFEAEELLKRFRDGYALQFA